MGNKDTVSVNQAQYVVEILERPHLGHVSWVYRSAIRFLPFLTLALNVKRFWGGFCARSKGKK